MEARFLRVRQRTTHLTHANITATNLGEAGQLASPTMGASILDETERQHWLEGLAVFDRENELVLLGVLCAFTKPATLLDVGCGTGAVVREARLLGIDAYGIDQMQDDNEHFKRVDLREKIDLFAKFDTVYSVEVAEHLEEQYEGEFCDTLARHTVEGGRLIFTAAPPGQGGYNHFNCQPKEYWRDRFKSRGMVYNVGETERLATIWRNTWVTLNHLARNVQVFNQP